jgi:hypothetical protein
VAEAGGRATSYLAALSSTLIALAFIGNMAGLSTAFYLFCSLLLPVLAFIGIVTFARLVQSTNEDIALAGRIARLRSFYVELVPELEPYLEVVRRGSVPGSLSEEREEPSKRLWQQGAQGRRADSMAFGHRRPSRLSPAMRRAMTNDATMTPDGSAGRRCNADGRGDMCPNGSWFSL